MLPVGDVLPGVVVFLDLWLPRTTGHQPVRGFPIWKVVVDSRCRRGLMISKR